MRAVLDFQRVQFEDYGIKWKVRCPYCGVWGIVTDEQKEGREEKTCANFRCNRVIIPVGAAPCGRPIRATT